jgi:hypothetical protein
VSSTGSDTFLILIHTFTDQRRLNLLRAGIIESILKPIRRANRAVATHSTPDALDPFFSRQIRSKLLGARAEVPSKRSKATPDIVWVRSG